MIFFHIPKDVSVPYFGKCCLLEYQSLQYVLELVYDWLVVSLYSLREEISRLPILIFFLLFKKECEKYSCKPVSTSAYPRICPRKGSETNRHKNLLSMWFLTFFFP